MTSERERFNYREMAELYQHCAHFVDCYREFMRVTHPPHVTAAREALEAARAALPAPADQVLVPKRLTRAMRAVLDEEGWTWEDLLAAAEAITEAEHAELQAVHGASDSNEQEPPQGASSLSDRELIDRFDI